MIKGVIVGCAILACSAVPAYAADRQLEKLFAMTADDFAAATTIKDDDMEAIATFTTEQGFKYKSGLFGLVVADGFIRAFVDKKSGNVKYQLYYYINNTGPSWYFINYANVMGVNGLQTIEALNVGRDVSCTRYGCNKLEQVAIPIDAADIRWAANRSDGADKGLSVRLKTQAGRDLDFTIVRAEAAGIVKRIDAYKFEHHLP